jgi:hypothetical protein
MRIFALLFIMAVCGFSFVSVAQEPVIEEPSVIKNGTAETSKYCDIVGEITNLYSYADTPWKGVPTALAQSEIRILISVNVDERSPHEKDDLKGQAFCGQGTINKVFSYKLCSPTPVKKGDRIHAVESTETGSKKSIGCLFDLKVLPKTNQK